MGALARREGGTKGPGPKGEEKERAGEAGSQQVARWEQQRLETESPGELQEKFWIGLLTLMQAQYIARPKHSTAKRITRAHEA